MNTLASFFYLLLKREILIGFRQPILWMLPISFFILVILIFSVVINVSNNTLSQVAPGVLWASTVLAALLAHDNLFRSDVENGYMEQLLLSPKPLTIVVLAKITAHWLQTGIPLLLIAPLASFLLFLPDKSLVALLFTLPLTTIIISILTSFGAALTVGKSNSLLTLILILPLSIPTLIFSTAIITGHNDNLQVSSAVLLLSSIGVFLLTVLPMATASVLRLSYQSR